MNSLYTLDKAFFSCELRLAYTTMATRINITQVANFDIHDESNLAQRWKKWKPSFKFYLTTSATDNDSQMRAIQLHWAGPDVQDIFMHLENVGTTYKAATTLNLRRMLYLRGTISSSYSRDKEAVY